MRLDFSVLEGSTLGRHDRVIATRDCGPVLTQLAKWPLQIESRPRATDIEEKEREREREREKEVNVHDITTKVGLKETTEERSLSKTVFPVVFGYQIPAKLMLSDYPVVKEYEKYFGMWTIGSLTNRET